MFVKKYRNICSTKKEMAAFLKYPLKEEDEFDDFEVLISSVLISNI